MLLRVLLCKANGFLPIISRRGGLNFQQRLPTTGVFRRFQSKNTAITETGGELAKDVVLYKHENPKFHYYASIFVLLQFTFWNFLGFNMLKLKDIPVSSEPESSFYKKINWGQDTTKKVMASACFLIGNVTLTFGWLFTLRSIRYMVLRKNRQMVSLVTYTPFGTNRFIEVPLNNISCQGSRTGAGYLPIKIKGRWFMFIADSRPDFATFPNPKLFDQTVGMHRKF